MGLISNKIGRDELRHGDHIYTWRKGYSYSHHGIYVGYGKVIHLTRGPGRKFSSSSQSFNDRVVYSNIEDFLCDEQLYRFEYGVSKILFVIKRAGTCSFASCKPPEDVLHFAFFFLDHGFGDYDLFNKNCEDFAFCCKTGFLKVNYRSPTGGSAQTTSFMAALATMAIVPLAFVPFIVLLPVLYVVYSLFRLVYAVPVEKLDSLRRQEDRREKSTRWYLGTWSPLICTIYAIYSWYWTPESRILICLRSSHLYGLLRFLDSDPLSLHDEDKQSKYIVCNTILIYGCLYWELRSVSAVILAIGFGYLMGLLSSYSSDNDHLRRSKISENIHKTVYMHARTSVLDSRDYNSSMV